jgi:hypothetical protein
VSDLSAGKWPLGVAAFLLAAACSASESTTTTTEAPAPAPPPTTVAASTTIPTPPTTQPEPSGATLIVPARGGITVHAEGDLGSERDDLFLAGDADYPVVAAFDDLAGGLVYQYSTTPEQFPPSSIMHVAADGSPPESVLYAEPGRVLGLLDVEAIDGRTTILYLEGPEDSEFDSILTADLAGGAPLLIALVDAGAEPGPAGVVPTGLIGGSLSEAGAAVIWSYGDIEASCSYVEVLGFDGDVAFGPIPELCGELDFTHAALSPDGARIAVAGEDLVQVIEIGSGALLGEWPVESVGGLDFDGSRVLATRAGHLTALSLRGLPVAEYDLGGLDASLITSARYAVDLTEGTFLGGVKELSANCSAAGAGSTIQAQGGLPEPVAVMRDAIVAAASSCDITALSMLGGDTVAFSFGGEPDAGRYWRWNEQEGYGALGRIVDILALPFLIEDWPTGRHFVWPSAFQEFPTEDDWQALTAVFNEEDVDLFKEFGSYIGMRVGIAEDGTWIFAVEGD